MLIITRLMDLEELLQKAKGKKVGVWTCRTCARLCDGLGGNEAAERLAERLRDNGVEVVHVGSASAACLDSKTREACKDDPFHGADVIISLTCDVGASRISRLSGIPCLPCTRTWGRGYLDEGKMPVLVLDAGDGSVIERPMKELEENGALPGPYA